MCNATQFLLRPRLRAIPLTFWFEVHMPRLHCTDVSSSVNFAEESFICLSLALANATKINRTTYDWMRWAWNVEAQVKSLLLWMMNRTGHILCCRLLPHSKLIFGDAQMIVTPPTVFEEFYALSVCTFRSSALILRGGGGVNTTGWRRTFYSWSVLALQAWAHFWLQ